MAKNILLISMDDAGAYSQFRDAFGVPLHVPHLDRIEAQSVSFRAAYAQAPVCGPSRASVMSGLSPAQTGIFDNYTNLFDVLRPEQLWQFQLKQRGYYCSTAGKVHHGYKPLAAEIHNRLYSHPPRPLVRGPGMKAAHQRFGGLTGGAGTVNPSNDLAYYDQQSASDAIQFLESYDSDRPFYREVGFHHPHTTWKTPIRFKELYDVTRFEQPAAWAKGFDLAEYPEQFYPGDVDLRDRDYWRKSVRNYFSALSHVDYQIGRVWEALQASRHAQNTIVVIMSDHGFHLGDKGRLRKFTLWEESARVPLIIHDPQASARVIDDPVANLDIGPTILDYCNCPPIGGSPGRSLREVVEGGASDDTRAVPTFAYGNVGIRKGRYRLIRYQTGETELQDVVEDPWFTRNLGPSHPSFMGLFETLLKTSATHGLRIDHPTAGFCRGSIGIQDAHKADFVPRLSGAHVHLSTLTQPGKAPLPAGFNRMHYGADYGSNIEDFSCFGHASDATFLFPGSARRFTLAVTSGPQTSQIRADHDDLIVWQQAGRAAVRASQSRNAVIAGAGDMMVQGLAGPLFIQGGAGDLTVQGQTGAVEVISGTGHNRITLQASEQVPELDLRAGTNMVTLSNSPAHLRLWRTGLPHRISGFASGVIDVSDWAALGTASLTREADRCVLRSTSETAFFYGSDFSVIRAALTGVPIEVPA